MNPSANSAGAESLAAEVVARFLKLADHRGFIEIRPSEVADLARDLGYRSSHWAHGDGLHWLAANLATAGHHPKMPDFRYRNGFVDPAQVNAETLAATLNLLLRPAPAPQRVG